jgi:hypothetical protein
MAPKEVVLEDGAVCLRDMAAEIRGQGAKVSKEIFSNAMGVDKASQPAYLKFAADHGLNIRFDKRNRMVFPSKKTRKKYCNLVGATDFDGGYGDPS